MSKNGNIESPEVLIFNHIKHIDKQGWKTRLGSALGLSTSTLYKKSRGETSLSADELIIIANEYGLSLDNILRLQNGGTFVQAPALNSPVSSIYDYLTRLAGELAGAPQNPDSCVLYASSEIPVFHYFHSASITAFKLAVWAKSVWDLYSDTSLELIIQEILEDDTFMALRSQLVLGYSHLPSKELWPATVLDNTLNQLQYYTWSGEIKDRQLIDLITEELILLVEHFEQMAILGQKFVMNTHLKGRPNSFSLYHNEIYHTNNTIILDQKDAGHVFLTHDSPNYIRSQDPAFFQHTKSWFLRMTGRSTQISVDNARHRRRFFAALKNKAQTMQTNILAIHRMG